MDEFTAELMAIPKRFNTQYQLRSFEYPFFNPSNEVRVGMVPACLCDSEGRL